MKWEEYKQLTAEQKDEYNFKYRDLTIPRVPVMSVIVIGFLLNIMLFIVFLISKEYIDIGMTAKGVLRQFTYLCNIIVLAFCIEWIGAWLIFAWEWNKRRKFVKKCIDENNKQRTFHQYG